MPGMTVYSPASQTELEEMLEQALQLGSPAAIRYNRGLLHEKVSGSPVIYGKWDVIRPPRAVTVIAAGRFVETVLHLNADIGLISARFIKPLDLELLGSLKHACKAVIVIEDGVVTGGLGSAVARYLSPSLIRVECMGLPDEPVPQGSIAEQDEFCELTEEYIYRKIKEVSDSI
jgi:1-deoxy-D-xylulose-5-phosphate synthase